MAEHIRDYVSAINANSFSGIGRPVPLKHALMNGWSRRLDETHRLIYKIEDNTLCILSCRYHYLPRNKVKNVELYKNLYNPEN